MALYDSEHTCHVLETDRMILRHFTVADVDGLLQIFSDPEAMRYYPSTKDRKETEAWIQWNIDSYRENGFGLWAVILKEKDLFIGDCGITYQIVEGVKEHEIGYHILREYWGRGLATEAAKACLEYGFQVLNCPRIVSIVHPANIASRTVAGRVHSHLRYFMKDGRELCLYYTERDISRVPPIISRPSSR